MQLFTGLMTGGAQGCLPAGAKALIGEAGPNDNQSAFMALLLAPAEGDTHEKGCPAFLRNLAMGNGPQLQEEPKGVKHLSAQAMPETGKPSQDTQRKGKGEADGEITREIPTDILCPLPDAVQFSHSDSDDSGTNYIKLAAPGIHGTQEVFIAQGLRGLEAAHDVVKGKDASPLGAEMGLAGEKAPAINAGALIGTEGGQSPEKGLPEGEGSLDPQRGEEMRAQSVSPLPEDPAGGSVDVQRVKTQAGPEVKERPEESSSASKGLDTKAEMGLGGEKALAINAGALIGVEGGQSPLQGLPEGEGKLEGSLDSQRGEEMKAQSVSPLQEVPSGNPVDVQRVKTQAVPEVKEKPEEASFTWLTSEKLAAIKNEVKEAEEESSSASKGFETRDPDRKRDGAVPGTNLLEGERKDGEKKLGPEIRVSQFSAAPKGVAQTKDTLLEAKSVPVRLPHGSIQFSAGPEGAGPELEMPQQERSFKFLSGEGIPGEPLSGKGDHLGRPSGEGDAEEAPIIQGRFERVAGSMAKGQAGETVLERVKVEAAFLQSGPGGKDESSAGGESEKDPLRGHVMESSDTKRNTQPGFQSEADLSFSSRLKGERIQPLGSADAGGPAKEVNIEALDSVPSREVWVSRDREFTDKGDMVSETPAASSTEAASRKSQIAGGKVRNEAAGSTERTEPVFKAVASALYNAKASRGEITLQLKPESLGRIRIRITNVEDRTVSVRIIADNPLSKEIIERGMGELRNELRINGVEMERCDVLLSEDQARDPGARAFRDHASQEKDQGQAPGLRVPSMELHAEEHESASGLSVFA